jgi:hypothetical protein
MIKFLNSCLRSTHSLFVNLPSILSLLPFCIARIGFPLLKSFPSLLFLQPLLTFVARLTDTHPFRYQNRPICLFIPRCLMLKKLFSIDFYKSFGLARFIEFQVPHFFFKMHVLAIIASQEETLFHTWKNCLNSKMKAFFPLKSFSFLLLSSFACVLWPIHHSSF